jgi:hypothetical protein
MPHSIRDSRIAAPASSHLHFGFVALLALCAGCELVLGDIPEKPGAGATGGAGGTGTSSGAGGAVGSGGTTPGSGGAIADAADEGCCDCDGDTVFGAQCGGDDCDDSNADAHPNQTKFFDVPRQGGSFDYDCNNSIEQDTKLLDCAVLATVLCGTTMDDGFLKPWPACGQSGNWGNCEQSGVNCVEHIVQTLVMRCR